MLLIVAAPIFVVFCISVYIDREKEPWDIACKTLIFALFTAAIVTGFYGFIEALQMRGY
jgi:hypothetical protein